MPRGYPLKHDRQYRLDAVIDHLESKRDLAESAVKWGVSYSTLRAWIKDLSPEIELRVVSVADEDGRGRVLVGS